MVTLCAQEEIVISVVVYSVEVCPIELPRVELEYRYAKSFTPALTTPVMARREMIENFIVEVVV